MLKKKEKLHETLQGTNLKLRVGENLRVVGEVQTEERTRFGDSGERLDHAEAIIVFW